MLSVVIPKSSELRKLSLEITDTPRPIRKLLPTRKRRQQKENKCEAKFQFAGNEMQNDPEQRLRVAHP